MAQGDKYAVRLNQPIDDPERRAEMAAEAAPRFGVGPDKVAKLIARKPGRITMPSSIDKAAEVANILTSVGVDVDLVIVDSEGNLKKVEAVAPPEPESKPVPEPAPKPEAAPEPDTAEPAPEQKVAEKTTAAPDADEHGFDAASKVATGRSDTSFPDERKVESRRRAKPEPEPEPEDTGPDLDDLDLDEEVVVSQRPRFPLLAKLLLGTLVPLLLLVGVTFYFANNAITDSTTRLLSEVGDNIALILAADFSNYLVENNLALDDEDAVFYFTRRLNDIQASLNETVGVHYTDANGVRIQGNWEPEITQNPDFPSFEQGFQQAAQGAIGALDFGASEERRRATLDERRVAIGGELGTFYTIASPLRDDVGTVQVVIAEGNIVEATRSVLIPISIAAAATLILAIIIVVLVAVSVSRRIRRLVRVAQRIANAELDEPVRIEGNDETRQLAEAFEQMRQELSAAFERLKRRERAARRRGRR
ncbi:MAG: HAMP domain-containing protein [Trueperaceae bacterium]|nr:HAMP domain-containing protein [Trueperaceae bacterium]